MKYFKLETDKPALSYKVGERMIFKITARDHSVNVDCRYLHWTLTGDDGKSSSGVSYIFADKPLILETSCDRPGFVHLYCRAVDEDDVADTSFEEFNGGAGAEPEKILYHDNLPDDYDVFWNKVGKLIDDFTPIFSEMNEVKCGVKDGFKCFDVRISTPFGNYASGYLTMPLKEGKYPIQLHFMGYEVAGALMCFEENTVCLTVNAHGIENGIPVFELKKMYPELCNYGFNNDENKRPETSYWYKMVIRNLCAAKAARSLDYWNGLSITVNGGSQGGFQALTVAAHDRHITGADVFIPWFCDLNAENCGYQAGWRPPFAHGLRYFDAAASGMFINCPVRIKAYLGDYVCPPSTIMALYNNIKSDKEIIFIQGGTHTYRHPEPREFLLTSSPEIKPGRYKLYKGEYIIIENLAENELSGDKYVIYTKDSDEKLYVGQLSEFAKMVYTENAIMPTIVSDCSD